jgi:hypothetical protein
MSTPDLRDQPSTNLDVHVANPKVFEEGPLLGAHALVRFIDAHDHTDVLLEIVMHRHASPNVCIRMTPEDAHRVGYMLQAVAFDASMSDLIDRA